MSQADKPRLRYFETSEGQRHIEASDHFIYRQDDPHYTINVIGTGTIGHEHMRVARLLGRARVGAIWDAAPHSLDTALANVADWPAPPRRAISLEDACQDPAADALFICTPNHTHLDVLRTALESGKAIFLEKPMATTVADAAEIVRLVDAYEPFVQIGLQYRYKAQYVEAQHELRERASIGELRTIAMTEYRPPFLDKVGQWNKFARFSGGTLVEKCCHYFDLMNLFAGARASRVFASGGHASAYVGFEYDRKPADIDDHAFVIVEYTNGVRASFALNMFAPSFQEELVLSGDTGVVRASERFDFLHDGRLDCRLDVEGQEPAARRSTVLGYPSIVESSGHHGSTWFEHLAFSDRIAGGESRAATPREGLWSVLVAAAAQSSIETGQPVAIDDLIDQFNIGDLCMDTSAS